MAYDNRAHAYNKKGQYDLAIADCDKAIELDHELAGAYYNRRLAYKEQGKEADAIVDFEKVIALMNDTQLVELAGQQIEELSK